MPIASKTGSKTQIEWQTSATPEAYDRTVAAMEARVKAIREGHAPELVWLLEHPPLYTAGTSAKEDDLVDPILPVYRTGRGGQWTYHGPGQRVAYVMLDLKARGGDLRVYVTNLEEWLIRTLGEFGLKGERRSGRIGIWIDQGGGRENKIAAVGVRVRQGVTYHGVSLNLDPNLDHYRGIVPCGVSQFGVTSLAALGIKISMTRVDAALKHNFERIFSAARTGGDGL
ncbi:MAG TPA: lipoyl(octanoyl) transferase LipB [Stellaceae bacterium]|nr:lipoyl(octanoyl) transferase LipB [Stellaceae bacterium]